MKKLKLMFCVASVMLMFNLGGCVYRTDIVQGQQLTLAQVQSIHNGMTRAMVTERLGAPVLTNPLQANRMVYIYRVVTKSDKVSEQTVVITLAQDHVVAMSQQGIH